MRVVIQRVSEAAVEVEGRLHASIDVGLVVLLGIEQDDTEQDADYLVRKATGLRIFSDEKGKMNHSISEAGGSFLVVSQFTLYGNCHKGMRPSYSQAASGEKARQLYDYFVVNLRNSATTVRTGVFQAHMKVRLVNDGPVTIICDSKSSKF